MSDLVVVSLERWDDVWRRNQYLVDGLLRLDPDLRVLFVEPPADPLHDARSRRRPERGHRSRPVGDTGRLWSWRPTKWFPRRIDAGFDGRFIRGIQDAADALGFRDPVLWVNDPRMAGVMTKTGWRTLYDITDDWAVADRPAAERDRIVEGESLLLAEADEVVACSPELEHRKAAQRPSERHPIVVIRNAVDVEDYQRPRRRPALLPAGRTAVYAGTLHEDRLDVDLVVSTAEALTGEVSIVLVGPNALGREATERVRSAGALLPGAQPRDVLIGCLQHAEVLIVPHLVNAFTDSLDPIKLYEYLAVGRPIVSTPVAGFRDELRCVGPAEYPAEVSAAARTEERSLRPGSTPGDWSSRVAEMHDVLCRMPRERGD